MPFREGPFEPVEALRDSVQEVLELMFFVAADEVESAALEEPERMLQAQVEFRGEWTGRCTVEMPEVCARAMTDNFTGIPGDGDVGVMIETICEFIIMVCGSTFTRLGCRGIVALSPPHLIEEWPAALAERSYASERWLDSGDGVVHVRFERETGS
jgi:hypothetical protein